MALQGETEELWSAVYYSTLNYRVRDAVGRYVTAERNLIYCAQTTGVEDHHLGDLGVPKACHSLYHQTRDAFQPVDYYLSDASEYQNVFRAYLGTRDMLNAIQP